MFDLVVIGTGPAGFNAAQEAKKLRLKCAVIDKDKIGGTCLNHGCIPTKTLIHCAKTYSLTKKSTKFGIEITDSKLNFLKIQERKNVIVEQLGKGMQFMLGDTVFLKGQAQFISNQELEINKKRIKTKHIIIATGSKPAQLPDLKFDGKKIVSSSQILDLKSLPHSLLIIGGGVIGCEFASLFSALGTQVRIIELLPQLLPEEDKEIAKKLETIFKKRGIIISTNTDAKTVYPVRKGDFSNGVNFDNYDQVLLCIGRMPELESLDFKKIGIQIKNNKIATDKYLRTNIPNIFAAGDCTGNKLLAHFAAHQGAIAVQNIANTGHLNQVSPQLIPNCVFTDPEIASIGITHQQANDAGIETIINRFDFLGSAMAHIIGETEGFIKIISDKKDGALLGASIIGPKATELIGIITIAIQAHLKISQLKNCVFAHPTLSESIYQATKN